MDAALRVKNLKEQLQLAESGLREQQTLEEQRQVLEPRYLETKESLHQSLKTLHSLPSNDRSRPKVLERSETLQGRMTELRQRLREIDHKLDALDEDMHSSIEHVRGQLIAVVIDRHPEAQGEWTSLQQSLKDQARARDFLQGVISSSEEVMVPLKTAIEARRTSRQRGLMNLIFGRNPSIIIAQYLDKTRQLLVQVLKETLNPIPTYLQAQQSAQGVRDLELLFSQLKSACEQPLAVKHIDGLFTELAEQCEAQITWLEAQRQSIGEALEETENAMRDWLERYTAGIS
jgi:chromosome segregation ATPase